MRSGFERRTPATESRAATGFTAARPEPLPAGAARARCARRLPACPRAGPRTRVDARGRRASTRVNETSATSSGFTQWTPLMRGGSSNAGRGRSSRAETARAGSPGRRRRSRYRPCRSSGARRPFRREPPSSSAPSPSREPRGSVKPTITNSWRFVHLIFSQARVRPARYGASTRLETIPSDARWHTPRRRPPRRDPSRDR